MTIDPSPSPHAGRPRGRGVYLLPNLFTTAVLFSGFYAIVAATDGNFDRAGIAIFVAMVCDGLDGRIARWTNTQTEFGKEYDSLSDMVAFGLAPAVVAYAKAAKADEALQAAVTADARLPEARLALARFRLRRGEPAKALEALEPIAASATSDPELAAVRIRALARAGRALDATQLAEAALAQRVKDPRLLVARAEMYQLNGDPAAAERLMRQALEGAPEDVGIRVALGRLALTRRDLAGAAKELSLAAEKGPRDPAAQAALGDLRLAEGKKEEAEAAFRRSLELDGEFAPAELGLARLALDRGDVAAARAGLERTLAIDPGNVEAQGTLGLILWKAGDLPGAEQALSAAAASAPKDALLRVRLGAVKLERGDVAGALEAAEAGSNLDLGLAEGHHWLGRALLARGEQPAALVQLGKAVELEPKNATYLIHLGLGREKANALGEALEAYGQAAAADPKLAEPHERLGQLYAQNDRCDKAVGAFEKALALAPDRLGNKVALADCRLRSGKAAEAVRLLKEVQRADPAQPVAYKLARAVHEAEGFKAAQPLYEKAVKAEPANPMPHYYLGYAYKEKRDRARAVQEFKAYLEAKPDAEDKVDILREIEDLGGK